ncbi:MAG: threonine synthase [Candidatus Jordarchaeum sp.]|uniref:threonine synthase n=1 Tax=Candidatus Jordarchaeum sp. TaxID=2823881 RepID=UPI004048FF76
MDSDSWLECISCHEKYDARKMIYTCEKCGHLLDVKYGNLETALDGDWKDKPISVWKYSPFLPRLKNVISLNEGKTNLYHCLNLAEKLGIKKLWVKNEGENPTGSFKDRGMTVGVSVAKSLGNKIVACASTGNTSASLAAYAAKAKMSCVVFIPSGKIALGKLAQAMMYGAIILAIKGNFDQALELVQESCEKFHMYLLNSLNPYRLEGQKTIGYEIIDQLNWQVPETIILPIGNAGNISAIYKGLLEWKEIGLIDRIPRMIGIQAEGSAPIANAYKKGEREVTFVEKPETVATAIRIGKPVNWEKALRAIYGTERGMAETVSDGEILEAQKMLARTEGIFVEPASASTIAGLRKLIMNGEIHRSERVVCVTTGHGLKDPDTAIKSCEETIQVEANIQEIEKILSEIIKKPVEAYAIE